MNHSSSTDSMALACEEAPAVFERHPVAIIGGTGLVGRHLAKALLTHPYLCLGPLVGSSRSIGMDYKEVWEDKETTLQRHYGDQFWKMEPFPAALEGHTVVSLEECIKSGVKMAVSCIAPSVGGIEDELVANGVKVFSISPYKRSKDNLCVLEVNFSKPLYQRWPKGWPSLDSPVGRLFKSPNCVCCGTTVVLQALTEGFGKLNQVSVTTFQSLSGRGDAKYPKELVVGNIYPLRGTSEPTEDLIQKEIKDIMGAKVGDVSVTAYRVPVQQGHLIDVRVNTERPVQSIEQVYAVLEKFRPFRATQKYMPSVANHPVTVVKEGGCPRPATHMFFDNGMSVAVGNIKINDGVFGISLSLVVNNVAKGAYGAALQLVEYYLYVQMGESIMPPKVMCEETQKKRVHDDAQKDACLDKKMRLDEKKDAVVGVSS